MKLDVPFAARGRELDSKALVVRLATCADDRQRLIALRTGLYRAAGKHQVDGPMLDVFDADALLVGVWKNGKPVACARVLCRAADQPFELDPYLQWHAGLPARDDVVEISRFCVAPSERNWRTIAALCRGVAAAAVGTGRRHVLGCSTAELDYFYATFFGARYFGLPVLHRDLGPKPHRLFICDMLGGLTGQTINPLFWLALWPEVACKALLQGYHRGDVPPWRYAGWLAKCHAAACISPLALRAIELLNVKRSK